MSSCLHDKRSREPGQIHRVNSDRRDQADELDTSNVKSNLESAQTDQKRAREEP